MNNLLSVSLGVDNGSSWSRAGERELRGAGEPRACCTLCCVRLLVSVGEEEGQVDENQKYIDSVIYRWCNRSEPPVRLGSLLFARAPLAFPCGSPRYITACVRWALFVCFLLSLQAVVSSSRCAFLRLTIGELFVAFCPLPCSASLLSCLWSLHRALGSSRGKLATRTSFIGFMPSRDFGNSVSVVCRYDQ